MTIPSPNLDNISFEEIFKQIRHKIPQFSELWTDHNFSDPGITFIELFSWLAEMQIFSLNTISKNSYLKFLQNLGFSQKPPTPTRIIVNFPTEEKLENLHIQKHSLLISDDEPNKIFQIEENIEILPCLLEKAYHFNPISGYYHLDNLEFEKDDPVFEPRSWNLMPFGADMIPQRALCLGFSDLDKYTGKTLRFFIKIKNEELEKFPFGTHGEEPTIGSSPTYAITGDSSKTTPIFWEWATKLNEFNKPVWKSLNVLSSTNLLTQSGIISFTIPFKKENKISIEKNNDSQTSELFWVRCSLVKDDYETPPIIDGIYLNPVMITSGQICHEPESPSEKIFVSNSLSNQKFVLRNLPIIKIHSLRSTVHSESSNSIPRYEFWNEVKNFDYSTGEDRHFTINYQSGEISFGDGEKGKIPEKNSMFEVIYRYGNAKTEINNNTEFNLQIKNQNLQLNKIAKSRFVASLGNDEESLEELYYRARSDLSIPYVAVTSEDFEYIAKSTPGLRIARTTAIVNENNSIGGNTVDITVIPYSIKRNPVPKRTFLDCVCKHIDKHRLLTTSIRILPPNYVEVTVKITIRTKTGVSKDIVKRKLEDFISPISRGEKLSGWPVGRSVYKSEISALIAQIPGVECIESLSLFARDQKGTFKFVGENIVIKKENRTNTFVYSGNHSINIVHSQQSCKTNNGEKNTN